MSDTSPTTPIASTTGELAPAWLCRFPELDPHRATLAKFKTVQALAKSYAMLERHMHKLAVKNAELLKTLGDARMLLSVYQAKAQQTNDGHESN